VVTGSVANRFAYVLVAHGPVLVIVSNTRAHVAEDRGASGLAKFGFLQVG